VKVADVMSTAVEFIGGNAPVKEAAELMGELDVGALPVGHEAGLDGILTDRDVLFRVVASGLDPKTTLVRDIASRPVISCRDSDALQVAMDLMAANHIRRLPVRDDSGTISGWVTLADISRKLLVESHGLQDALRTLTEDGQATEDGQETPA
jgi:CBS domain-containing protein